MIDMNMVLEKLVRKKRITAETVLYSIQTKFEFIKLI